MRLILIRHGESEHGKRRLIAGVAGCLGLTELGRVQARALADRLAATGELGDCAALLHSPVPRARQTAEIVGRALPGVQLAEEPGLAELLPGVADGMVWPDYAATHGAFDMTAEPERPFAPAGESWRQFMERVESTMAGLAERYAGQTVVGVSHGGFVMASLLALFAIPRPGTGAWLEPGFASLTEWKRGERGWQLERYNDAAHLLARQG